MHVSSLKPHCIAAIFAAVTLLGSGVSHATLDDSRHTGWYIAAGAGADWASLTKQSGHNLDTTCYPDDDCSDLPDGMPSGYRWFYDLDPSIGSAFELSVGRMFHNFRLELSATRRGSDIEQQFRSVSYLDGSATTPLLGSSYESSATARVDDLTTRTLSANVYYDFPLARSRITPYVGAGLGVSFVELSGVHYHSRYSCTGVGQCVMPERYNSRQDVDMSDTVLSAHLHAGADYRLNDRFLLGLKLSYSMMDDFSSRDGYSQHVVPGMTGFTEISGTNHWSLMLNAKYLFSD